LSYNTDFSVRYSRVKRNSSICVMDFVFDRPSLVQIDTITMESDHEHTANIIFLDSLKSLQTNFYEKNIVHFST